MLLLSTSAWAFDRLLDTLINVDTLSEADMLPLTEVDFTTEFDSETDA